MLRNILAVAWKELQIIVKDKGWLAVLFLLPLMMSMLFGSIGKMVSSSEEGGDEAKALLSVYLVDDDKDEYSKQVVSALRQLEVLDVQSLQSLEEADQLVASGEKIAAIYIPAGFTKDIAEHTPTKIEVILDPVQQNYGSLVTGMVNYAVSPVVLQGEIRYGIRTVMEESGVFEEVPAEVQKAVEAQSFGVIMTQLMELNANPLIEIQNEDISGDEVASSWNPTTYNTPAFTVMFAFFLTAMAAAALLREKEEGSMRRLLASPIQRGAILAGKMLAYAFVVLMQVIVLFSVSHFIFDMPLGDPLALVTISVPLALTATGLGMMLAALTKTSKQADSMGNILSFVLAGLGGCISPFFLQEGFMGLLSRLTPHAHALIAYMDIMNKSATWITVLPQAGILLGFALVFYLVAIWRFKFD